MPALRSRLASKGRFLLWSEYLFRNVDVSTAHNKELPEDMAQSLISRYWPSPLEKSVNVTEPPPLPDFTYEMMDSGWVSDGTARLTNTVVDSNVHEASAPANHAWYNPAIRQRHMTTADDGRQRSDVRGNVERAPVGVRYPNPQAKRPKRTTMHHHQTSLPKLMSLPRQQQPAWLVGWDDLEQPEHEETTPKNPRQPKQAHAGIQGSLTDVQNHNRQQPHNQMPVSNDSLPMPRHVSKSDGNHHGDRRRVRKSHDMVMHEPGVRRAREGNGQETGSVSEPRNSKGPSRNRRKRSNSGAPSHRRPRQQWVRPESLPQGRIDNCLAEHDSQELHTSDDVDSEGEDLDGFIQSDGEVSFDSQDPTAQDPRFQRQQLQALAHLGLQVDLQHVIRRRKNEHMETDSDSDDRTKHKSKSQSQNLLDGTHKKPQQPRAGSSTGRYRQTQGLQNDDQSKAIVIDGTEEQQQAVHHSDAQDGTMPGGSTGIFNNVEGRVMDQQQHAGNSRRSKQHQKELEELQAWHGDHALQDCPAGSFFQVDIAKMGRGKRRAQAADPWDWQINQQPMNRTTPPSPLYTSDNSFDHMPSPPLRSRRGLTQGSPLSRGGAQDEDDGDGDGDGGVWQAPNNDTPGILLAERNSSELHQRSAARQAGRRSNKLHDDGNSADGDESDMHADRNGPGSSHAVMSDDDSETEQPVVFKTVKRRRQAGVILDGSEPQDILLPDTSTQLPQTFPQQQHARSPGKGRHTRKGYASSPAVRPEDRHGLHQDQRGSENDDDDSRDGDDNSNQRQQRQRETTKSEAEMLHQELQSLQEQIQQATARQKDLQTKLLNQPHEQETPMTATDEDSGHQAIADELADLKQQLQGLKKRRRAVAEKYKLLPFAWDVKAGGDGLNKGYIAPSHNTRISSKPITLQQEMEDEFRRQERQRRLRKREAEQQHLQSEHQTQPQTTAKHRKTVHRNKAPNGRQTGTAEKVAATAMHDGIRDSTNVTPNKDVASADEDDLPLLVLAQRTAPQSTARPTTVSSAPSATRSTPSSALQTPAAVWPLSFTTPAPGNEVTNEIVDGLVENGTDITFMAAETSPIPVAQQLGQVHTETSEPLKMIQQRRDGFQQDHGSSDQQPPQALGNAHCTSVGILQQAQQLGLAHDNSPAKHSQLPSGSLPLTLVESPMYHPVSASVQLRHAQLLSSGTNLAENPNAPSPAQANNHQADQDVQRQQQLQQEQEKGQEEGAMSASKVKNKSPTGTETVLSPMPDQEQHWTQQQQQQPKNMEESQHARLPRDIQQSTKNALDQNVTTDGLQLPVTEHRNTANHEEQEFAIIPDSQPEESDFSDY